MALQQTEGGWHYYFQVRRARPGITPEQAERRAAWIGCWFPIRDRNMDGPDGLWTVGPGSEERSYVYDGVEVSFSDAMEALQRLGRTAAKEYWEAKAQEYYVRGFGFPAEIGVILTQPPQNEAGDDEG